jgi:hypothetical protein
VYRLAFRITHGNHPRFLRFPRTFQCLAVPRQPLKLLETLETRVLKRLASAVLTSYGKITENLSAQCQPRIRCTMLSSLIRSPMQDGFEHFSLCRHPVLADAVRILLQRGFYVRMPE